MSALQAAANVLLTAAGGVKSLKGSTPQSTLGVRSLREEYQRPMHRNDLIRNLQLIGERIARDPPLQEMLAASAERLDLPRFQHLFKGGDLLPAGIFLSALELGPAETLNGRQLPYDADVLILRDHLVMAYKPLVAKIRQLHSKEIDDLPLRMVRTFAGAWSAWESTWLHNREVHAVEALQPLAKAILALEPLILSAERERLLPWPRVRHQKAVTLKCLEGFVHSFSELAACVLPSLQRELDHDPRLLLLMDHVLSLRGEKPFLSCLDGLSAAPDVNFPDHQAPRPATMPSIVALADSKDPRKGMTLDAYAFKLLGSSVGDAAAAGKLRATSGNGQAGRAKLAQSLGAINAAGLKGMPEGPKESGVSRKAASHATEMLVAFESVKDMLLSLKSTLEYIDPSLDHDEAFVGNLQRFERASRRAKRLFLEPDNLA